VRNVRTPLAIVVTTLLPAVMVEAQPSITAALLLEEFKRTPVFWQQLEVAKELATVADAQVLTAIEPLLRDDDRHVRANVAFVFARADDRRGFEALSAILVDRSDRPIAQGIAAAGSFNPAEPRWWLASQIHADRYYAVHVLGELKDSRGADILIPLLGDPEVNYHVAWALGQIGDRRAIGALITTLEDRDALVRVSAIEALDALNAKEAMPQLFRLLNDQAIPSAGPQVSVAEAAKAAIARLQKKP
jgi:HEAT repeat protein